MSRYAARCSRAASAASRAGSPRSQPSVTSRITAPRPSTRRDQRTLNSPSASPMRVPPDQSATARDTRARALPRLAKAAAPARTRRPLEAFEEACRGRALVRGHRGEVRVSQELDSAGGKADRPSGLRRQRAGQRGERNVGAVVGVARGTPHRARRGRRRSAEEGPEEIEGLLERREIALTHDERRAGRGADVLLVSEVDLGKGTQEETRALRIDVDTCPPQQTRQDEKVLRDELSRQWPPPREDAVARSRGRGADPLRTSGARRGCRRGRHGRARASGAPSARAPNRASRPRQAA